MHGRRAGACERSERAIVGGPVRIRLKGRSAREGRDGHLIFAVGLDRAARIRHGSNCVLWMGRLVLANSAGAARGSRILAAWLVEMRPLAFDAQLSKSWQNVVDALIVEGVTRLAQYSD